jgi:hypothetical protein
MTVDTRILLVCTQTGETSGKVKLQIGRNAKITNTAILGKVRKEGNKNEIKNAEKNDKIKMMTKNYNRSNNTN